MLLLFLLAVAFGALNKQTILIDFMFGQINLPVAALAAIMLLLGFVIGLLAMLGRVWLARREQRKLQQQLTQRAKSNA